MARKRSASTEPPTSARDVDRLRALLRRAAGALAWDHGAEPESACPGCATLGEICETLALDPTEMP